MDRSDVLDLKSPVTIYRSPRHASTDVGMQIFIAWQHKAICSVSGPAECRWMFPGRGGDTEVECNSDGAWVKLLDSSTEF